HRYAATAALLPDRIDAESAAFDQPGFPPWLATGNATTLQHHYAISPVLNAAGAAAHMLLVHNELAAGETRVSAREIDLRLLTAHEHSRLAYFDAPAERCTVSVFVVNHTARLNLPVALANGDISLQLDQIRGH